MQSFHFTYCEFCRDATANVVILSEDPNTGEITQEIVSAEQLNAVVEQQQLQAEEEATQDVSQAVDTEQVELPEDQLISSQVAYVD